MMLAVLPRRNSDDVGGELFVAAYQHKLGHLPESAINYITDKALGQCKWFPTIAECLELLLGWRRNDAASARRDHASRLVGDERRARDAERWAKLDEQDQWRPTAEELAEIKAQATKNLTVP